MRHLFLISAIALSTSTLTGCAAVAVTDAAVGTTVGAGRLAVKGTVGAARVTARGVGAAAGGVRRVVTPGGSHEI